MDYVQETVFRILKHYNKSKEGDKIDGTQALLLDKLKIYPFSYKMNITKILQDGAVFDAKVL